MKRSVVLPVAMSVGMAFSACTAEQDTSKHQESIQSVVSLNDKTCRILGKVASELFEDGVPVLSLWEDKRHGIVGQSIYLGDLPIALANSIADKDHFTANTEENQAVLTTVGTLNALEDSMDDMDSELSELPYGQMVSARATHIISKYTPMADQARNEVATTFETYCEQ